MQLPILIFLTIKKFLMSYFPEAELLQPWRGFVQRTYTQTVLLEMSREISA